jgi:hypothetical protein
LSSLYELALNKFDSENSKLRNIIQNRLGIAFDWMFMSVFNIEFDKFRVESLFFLGRYFF